MSPPVHVLVAHFVGYKPPSPPDERVNDPEQLAALMSMLKVE